MRRAALAGALLAAAGCIGSIQGSGPGDDGDSGDGPGAADAAIAGPDATPVPATDLGFCVEETNRFRAMAGKGPLAHSAALEAYASEGAEYDTLMMSAHAHFAATGGGGIAQAENECPSFLGWNLGGGTVRQAITGCIQAFYDEGPGGGHYDNMMANHGHVGCGVYLSGGGGVTIVQDLGP